MSNFEVLFYAIADGSSPISAFLDKLSDSARSKVTRQIRYMEEFGLTSAVPSLRKVSSYDFWEVRILGKDNIRMFCIQRKERVLVLHIFAKKTEKTPLKELELAKARILTIDT